MALIKLGGFITQLSGKIGGQSISNRGSQTTIRNIVHTNKTPTFKQSVQRFQTARIVNRFLFLSDSQKNAWATASADYEYINRVGDTLTRTAFGTFCFLNQNLNLIGQAIRNSPPLYVPAVSPSITIDNYGSSSLVISSSDADSIYTYGLYAVANLSAGATGQRGKMRFCGTISETDLTAGIDIIPQIANVFGPLSMPNNIGFFISAINTDTGNRTQNETIYTQEVIAGIPIVFDPDYQAVLDYADTNGISTPTVSQQILQNQLMIDIKNAVGLSAFDWLYIMANDAGQPFAWINWCNPNKFTQNGTWNYSTNLGLRPRFGASVGFTGNYTPSTDGVAYTKDNASYGFKVGNSPGAWATGDALLQSLNAVGDITQVNGTVLSVAINQDTTVRVDDLGQPERFDDPYAYTVINRPNSSQVQMFHNSVDFGLKTSVSTGLPNSPIIFGVYLGDFSLYTTVLHLGRALTLSEAQALDTIFDNYISSI